VECCRRCGCTDSEGLPVCSEGRKPVCSEGRKPVCSEGRKPVCFEDMILHFGCSPETCCRTAGTHRLRCRNVSSPSIAPAKCTHNPDYLFVYSNVQELRGTLDGGEREVGALRAVGRRTYRQTDLVNKHPIRILLPINLTFQDRDLFHLQDRLHTSVGASEKTP
jgi:hypothetical protein